MNPMQTSELTTTEKSAQDKLAELCNEAISTMLEAAFNMYMKNNDVERYMFNMGLLAARMEARASALQKNLYNILDTAKQ